MKVAYLIDRESLGGGCEYIRRKAAEVTRRGDVWRVFYSVRRECSALSIDTWGADEIVVNHLRALMQLLCRPWRRPKGRITFVVHGIHLRKYDWMAREGDGPFGCVMPWLKKSMRRALESRLYHRCDRIVALTATDRDDILRLYGSDLPVVVEPNTLEDWHPVLAEGCPPGIAGPFDFVCVGRFDYPKGQDRLIRALSTRQFGGNGGRTLFIGDGDTLNDCRALAERLGVADRCVFAGTIPDAERYLRCADAVVSPSRWEGMPYLMMKARALGCRILATDCPGNRDVLSGYDKWEVLDL